MLPPLPPTCVFFLMVSAVDRDSPVYIHGELGGGANVYIRVGHPAVNVHRNTSVSTQHMCVCGGGTKKKQGGVACRLTSSSAADETICPVFAPGQTRTARWRGEEKKRLGGWKGGMEGEEETQATSKPTNIPGRRRGAKQEL